MPVTVPDLNPGVIAALVEPQRRRDHARRNAHRATRIDQQDGQPRAGGQAGLHRFQRTLIRPAALRGVTHARELEEFLVQALRCLGGRLAIRDQRRGEVVKFPPPRVARFINRGVGQNVVEENLLRHAFAPRRPGERLVSQRKILFEVRGGKCGEIPRRHVLDHELHPLALRLRHVVQRLDDLSAIRAGLRQSPLRRGRPPTRGSCCGSLSPMEGYSQPQRQ